MARFNANAVHLPMSHIFGILDDVADELVKQRERGESVTHRIPDDSKFQALKVKTW